MEAVSMDADLRLRMSKACTFFLFPSRHTIASDPTITLDTQNLLELSDGAGIRPAPSDTALPSRSFRLTICTACFDVYPPGVAPTTVTVPSSRSTKAFITTPAASDRHRQISFPTSPSRICTSRPASTSTSSIVSPVTSATTSVSMSSRGPAGRSFWYISSSPSRGASHSSTPSAEFHTRTRLPPAEIVTKLRPLCPTKSIGSSSASPCLQMIAPVLLSNAPTKFL
mmetsp:Transcript_12308/g.29409  ORF Transcript_12308/g.29409 Transcript_12308/m.29409 type:complete len:226 (-) Transcript_12308:253-930(-)